MHSGNRNIVRDHFSKNCSKLIPCSNYKYTIRIMRKWSPQGPMELIPILSIVSFHDPDCTERVEGGYQSSKLSPKGLTKKKKKFT